MCSVSTLGTVLNICDTSTLTMDNSSATVTAVIATILILLITYIFITYFKKSTAHYRHPPAFRSLPFVGSVLFLPSYEKLSSEFMTMSQTLGDVFSVYIGNRCNIVINSADVLHEALLKRSSDFASRPAHYSIVDYVNPKRKGIINAVYGDSFKKYRKLALTILKDFGFGQTIMEDRIRAEVEGLVSTFRSMNGASVFPNTTLMLTVMNVIASILFGKRFEDNDPKLKKLVESTHKLIIGVTKVQPINAFPFLRYWPSMKRKIREILAYEQDMLDICEENIADSLAGRSEKGFASCFVDAEGPDYDKEELLRIMRDLILAGADTSSTTLQWALIAMANHQDIQKRIQRDIDDVVPRTRLPSLSDKTQLPYIEATICEVMRRWTLVPLGLAHATVCDTEVGGYFVPAGTTVITNLYSCHMNPKSWINPETFRPERFLDSEEKLINKDRIVSFSLGKRSCLGELLARQEIYLFFTGLLQNFNILPEVGQDKVDYKEQVGVTLGPVDCKLRLVPRLLA